MKRGRDRNRHSRVPVTGSHREMVKSLVTVHRHNPAPGVEALDSQQERR